MMFGFFVFAGCDSINLLDYKATKIIELQAYLEGKEEENYTEENLLIVQQAFIDGKVAIDEMATKQGVNTAVNNAKKTIDLVQKDKNIMEHKAIIIDGAIEWMHLDYIEENTTRNSLMLESMSYPKTFTHLITSQSDFEIAFSRFPAAVDFESEMLLIYFFTGDILINSLTGERIFTYQINDLNILDEYINIVFVKKVLVSGPTGSPPTQECLVVKMNKIDAVAAIIELMYE